MNKIMSSIAAAIIGFAAQCAENISETPFSWSHDLEGKNLKIEARIAKDSYLYQERTKISITDSSGKHAILIKTPSAISEKDIFDETHQVFPEGRSIWEYSLEGLSGEISAKIEFQGCSKSPFVCYPPRELQIPITSTADATRTVPASLPKAEPAPENLSWKELAGKFTVSSQESGYMDQKSFLKFLDDSAKLGNTPRKTLFEDLQEKNFLVSLLLILIGGLALNLTPCVLPMIPVNLAIIGAGVNSSSRLSGFILGLMYGAGMAVAYGILGLVAILTGSTFGSINSSPYFNYAAGLVFILLALSMFDILHLDLSKFIKPGKSNSRRSLVTAMSMGGVSAVLAGACVAPVVIAVLLFSSYLYSQGNYYGLALPFLLGIGMALPWPFAGAGLSLLPKPGAWMVKVKYAFGIFIAGIASYYIFTGYSIMFRKDADKIASGKWGSSLYASLTSAKKENRPILIDFTASWCKNCEAMDLSTLREPAVMRKLEMFEKVKFRAENPNEPATKEVLSYFKVLGLPTYVVLKPSTSN